MTYSRRKFNSLELFSKLNPISSFFRRINVSHRIDFSTRTILKHLLQPYFSILDETYHTPAKLIWTSPFLFTVGKFCSF